MSAYNKLQGEHCANNRWLLTDVLRGDWGFDGFVVSDWFGSHHTAASAHAGLTIAMPGPKTIYGEPLARAVADGDVSDDEVQARVDEVLELIRRTRADELSSERPELTVDDADERALCRRAVAESAVLARNGGALPLDPATTIAVIGPNALDTRIMGGGSAGLEPLPHRGILTALQDRAEAVSYAPGVHIDRLAPPLPERRLRTTDGRTGLLVEYRNGHDPDAEVAASEVSPSTLVRFFGSTPDGVDPEAFHVTIRGTFVPEVSGPHLLSAVITGKGHVQVGPERVLDDPERSLPRGPLFFGWATQEQNAVLDCVAGVPVDITMTCTGMAGNAGLRLGVRPPEPPDLLERAVDAAARAHTAVVVVGTNDEWETEGEDRTTISLPGDQDELVHRVAAANPRTVVVVNAGSPVAMPWIDEVDAVVLTWFGGLEMGDGVADVLLGEADPGGRLPITFPKRLEDTPAWPWYAPVDGQQRYGEGLLMGYRGFDAADADPLLPFGHGLSYGEAAWTEPALSSGTVAADAAAGGASVEASVLVTATGDRAATVVVQGYVAPHDPVPGSAPKSLACWRKVVVEPGTPQRITLAFPSTAFRRWDTDAGAWTVDTGGYDLLLAASATDIRHRLSLTLT